MKLSILMPTYNDGETIIESLDSVKNQKNKNWELIIINDGSNDESDLLIKQYIKKNHLSRKIKYLYQENQDQLRAIINGSKYITGDYVMFLHSDDLYASENTVDYIFDEFKNNKNIDAMLHDLLIIDENSTLTGEQKIKKYNINNYIPPLQLLFLGRNIYADFFVATKKFFTKSIMENYLLWNRPFWLSVNNECKMANVINCKNNLVKYRVHSGNYINNEIGKLNVINGELRTAINLMKYYHIPFYKIQFFIYRIFNKLNINYIPFYKVKEEQKKDKIIKFILEKRFNNEWQNNMFLDSIYDFFKNYCNRKVVFQNLNEDTFIYYGCDMRRFNKKIVNKDLEEIYIEIMKEMKKGFNTIVVPKKDIDSYKVILKFLCIDKFVIVKGQ